MHLQGLVGGGESPLVMMMVVVKCFHELVLWCFPDFDYISRELGRLMQAVVLSQFCQEPNYAQVSSHLMEPSRRFCHFTLFAIQAFKFLEDSTEDGADSLYGCIWDMATKNTTKWVDKLTKAVAAYQNKTPHSAFYCEPLALTLSTDHFFL